MCVGNPFTKASPVEPSVSNVLRSCHNVHISVGNTLESEGSGAHERALTLHRGAERLQRWLVWNEETRTLQPFSAVLPAHGA